MGHNVGLLRTSAWSRLGPLPLVPQSGGFFWAFHTTIGLGWLTS
jgi:hypothetical protein